jgi:DNA polymerase III subunit delta
MFYLLHGEDEFTNREHLKKLRQQGDFGFSQDIYSGVDADIKTIIINSETLPFLSSQRLIIIDGLPKKKRGESTAQTDTSSSSPSEENNKGARPKKGKKTAKTGGRAGFEKELAEHIATMPETTQMILIVEETLDHGNVLVKAAEQHGKVVQSALPKGAALERWITQRAKTNTVKITSEATQLLTNFIGNNLRLLANEIDKLAMFVGTGNTINADDVRRLSAQVQEARIFDLTDALAQKNRKQALNILHDLLADGEPPLKLISTITSQVRSLLLVKELAQKGMRSPQIAAQLGIAPFIVDKSFRQVGNFSLAQLEHVYHQLLETDAALKRSRLTPEMALDFLVVQFAS